VVPVLGGVAGVGAIAVVAVMMMSRAPKSPASPTPADSGQAAAPAPAGTQTAANTAAANPAPGGRPGGTATPPRPQPSGKEPVPQPPAVSVPESLRAANVAFDGNNFDVAIRLGQWVYGSATATTAQKISAAKLAATAYVQQNNSADALTWYHNVLRYDPNDQAVKDLIRQLGGTP
jgi:hypothetical protein